MLCNGPFKNILCVLSLLFEFWGLSIRTWSHRSSCRCPLLCLFFFFYYSTTNWQKSVFFLLCCGRMGWVLFFKPQRPYDSTCSSSSPLTCPLPSLLNPPTPTPHPPWAYNIRLRSKRGFRGEREGESEKGRGTISNGSHFLLQGERRKSHPNNSFLWSCVFSCDKSVSVMPFVFVFVLFLKEKRQKGKNQNNKQTWTLADLSFLLLLLFFFWYSFFSVFASNLFWIFSFLFFPPFFLNPRSAHKKTWWIFNEQASRRRYFCCMFFLFSCFEVFLGDVYTCSRVENTHTSQTSLRWDFELHTDVLV